MIEQLRLPDWVFEEMRRKQYEMDSVKVREAEQALAYTPENPLGTLAQSFDFGAIEAALVQTAIHELERTGHIRRSWQETRQEYFARAMKEMPPEIRRKARSEAKAFNFANAHSVTGRTWNPMSAQNMPRAARKP